MPSIVEAYLSTPAATKATESGCNLQIELTAPTIVLGQILFSFLNWDLKIIEINTKQITSKQI